MKAWARSKGTGPHFACGMTIATSWGEFDIDEGTFSMLSSIESIEVSDKAPAGGEPAALPVSEDEPVTKKKRK